MIACHSLSKYLAFNNNFRSIHKFIFFILLTTLVTVLFVRLMPNMPGDGLDPSWKFAMNEAVAKGLNFGKNIVFTFGPYSSVYTESYHPATDHLMVITSTYLAMSFSIVSYLNFKNAWLYLQILLLLALGLSANSQARDPIFYFYLLMVGVYVYKTIISCDSKKVAKNKETIILIILFIPFGLYPLVKGSFLIACMLIALLSAFLLILSGRLNDAIITCITPVVSMSMSWLIVAAPLNMLPHYFMSLAPIVDGYSEAMAIYGNSYQILIYLITSLSLFFFVFSTKNSFYISRIIVSLMFLSVLFLTFKAGFVRHDGHAVIAGMMILLATLLAATLLSSYRVGILLIGAIITWKCIDTHYSHTTIDGFVDNVKTAYAKFMTGLQLRLYDAGRLDRDFNQKLAQLNARGSIPHLDGTVDIYPYDQSYLISSGNQWNPRPVLQSYSAYTLELAEMNKNHLIGSNRPENILFKIQPIDNRFPSLEDGASWPVLISDYEPTTYMNGYLLLKHRSSIDVGSNKTERIYNRRFSVGEKIDLPEVNGAIYAKLTLKKSILGKIVNNLFKTSELEIQLTMRNDNLKKYRIIASMAEAGFLLSPLIENAEEFGLLFAQKFFLDNKKIVSIIIKPIKHSELWQKNFQLQLYLIEPKISPNINNLYNLTEPVEIKGVNDPLKSKECYGNIDAVNGISPVPSFVLSDSLFKVSGWLFPIVEEDGLPEKVYVIISGNEGNRLIVETRRVLRPDVAAAFNKPHLITSGFETTANFSNLKGNYSISLAYSKGDALFLCPEFNIKTSASGH